MALPNVFSAASSSGGGGGGGGGFNPRMFTASSGVPEDPEVIKRKSQLASVASLAHGNDNDREMADQFLKDNAQMYTDEELASYGLQRPTHDSRSLWDKAKGAAGGAIQAAFGTISRPQQVVAHGLNAVGTGIAGLPGVFSGDIGVGDYAKGMARMAGETWQSAGDIKGEHDINSREMLNLDKNAGGSGWFGDYVAGGADVLGQMVLDPLSWTGGAGTKEAAKAGLKALVEAEARGLARPGIAARVAKEGGGIVTEAERQATRDILRETMKASGAGERGRLASLVLGEGGKTGSPLARFKEGALQSAAGLRDDGSRLTPGHWLPKGTGLAGGERRAENALSALLNRGQRGIKFGGQTILASEKLRAPLEARGLINATKLVDNPALAAIQDEAATVAERLQKAEQRIAEAQESKTAWSSKSSEALPQAVAERDELSRKYQEVAAKLNDADPEAYVPPREVPNPDLPKANQEYLRHTARQKQIDLEMSKLDESDAAVQAQRKDLQAQIDNLEKSKLNFQHRIGGTMADATPRVINDALADTQANIDALTDQLHDLDLNGDDIADKIADLSAEYEDVGRKADEAGTTPETIYEEGKTVANPELDTRAKLPVNTEIGEPSVLPDGTQEIKATVDGKPASSVNYHLDADGKVHIDGIITLDNQQRQGIGRELLRRIEEATGQKAADFDLDDNVLDTGKGFWDDVKAEGAPEGQKVKAGEAPPAAAAEVQVLRDEAEGLMAQLDAADDLDAPLLAPIHERLDEIERQLGALEPGPPSGLTPSTALGTTPTPAAVPPAPAAPAKPATRPSLARQTKDAERDLERAKRRADLLEKKVGVTAEKQVARAEGKIERLTKIRDDLLARQASINERLPRIPEQAEEFTPSKLLGGRVSTAQTRLKRAFQTGSEVAERHGARAKEALANLRELALGTAETSSHQAVRTLRNVLHAAAGEDKTFLDDFPKIYSAMEHGAGDELAMQYAEAGRERASDAVRTLVKMNAEDTKALVDEGWLPEEFLHNATEGGGYMKRMDTPIAAKARRAEEEGVRRGSPARPASSANTEAAQGSLKQRTWRPGDPLSDDLQAEGAARLGLPEGTKVIDDNPYLSVGAHRTELEHGRAHRQFLEGASQIYDDAGLPLVTKDADLARTHGYVHLTTPEGTYYAPKAVAGEVARFQSIVLNDETIKAYQRTLDKTMRIWKAHATVPLVGLAFHSRNAETNVMLNWIAGVENPVWYARSARAQSKLSKAMKLLGPDTDIEKAMEAAKLTGKEKRIVQLAQKHNILATSQAAIDLAGQGGTGMARQLGREAAEPGIMGRIKRAPSKANAFNPETFMGTTTGHALAGGLENNARLAHFMWALDKYGDPEIAAQSVKKYLFNYADLTAFEREKLKRVIPFYTFMRKNVGLMATTLAENPGKMSRFAIAQRQTEDGNAGFLKDQLIPEYVTEMGQAPRKGLPGLGGMTASIESPWSAAADTLAPVGEAAGLVPGLNRIVPDAYKGKGPEETALKLLNIPGGPAAESLKYITERALGKDTFTGGDVRKMNPLGEGLRIMDIFAPSPSKVTRLLDKGTQGDVTGKHTTPAQGDERTRRRAATVVNAIFGLNTNGVGDQATSAEITRRFYELQDYLDVRNKDLGEGDKRRVPTVTELRKQGILPSRSSSSGVSYRRPGG